MIDSALPSLSEILSITCYAEVARRICKPRAYVWRLRYGFPLRDEGIVPALARALYREEEWLRAVVRNDLVRFGLRGVA